MKRLIVIAMSIIMAFALTACGGSGGDWSRAGYFQDDSGNFLSISKSDNEEYEDWYVGCTLDGKSYGWYIGQEGDILTGNLQSDEEEADFVVTISEEGEDGVLLTTGEGSEYHFTPVPTEETEITIQIKTEGNGFIKYAIDGEALDLDEEFTDTAAQLKLEGPEKYTLVAKAGEGSKFVKWTSNGEDYSTDEKVDVEFTENAEFIAVFESE